MGMSYDLKAQIASDLAKEILRKKIFDGELSEEDLEKIAESFKNYYDNLLGYLGE